MITGQQMVDEARRWVGVPFRHQGRTRFGVDCIGLGIVVRNECEPWPEGMATPTDYRRNPLETLEVELKKFCTQIQHPEKGCFALIKWPKQKFACHVGLITPDHIIHAYAGKKTVVETGYRDPWIRMTVSFWRMPGVTP